MLPVTDGLRDQLQASLGAAYVLERELGGGGMSRVFVAREEALGRDVVVKVLAPALVAELSAERFTREIRLTAALQEPHIVPVLATGQTADGLPYYLMPYVAGKSLRARLRQQAEDGPVPLTEAVSILRDVARALAYAHAHGVVHRDVKPENVLLSSGTAVVTDFGIAKAVQLSTTRAPGGPPRGPVGAADGTLTLLGASLGTPAYMAPEQAAGDPRLDARADVYAWGVLAYELLADRHPFAEKATAHAMVTAHIGEAPRPLREVTPAVPAALAALVMRCLAKDPALRPASAAEALAALDGAATAPPSPVARPRRRQAAMATGIAAAMLAGAGIAWHARQNVATASPIGPTRLAVLPFDNAGPAEQAVFTDGLTDAVAAKLGALPGLAVIDRHSALQYRATAKPARQIGTELGVPYLVEGVVRWARDGAGAWRAQVTPMLVDATSGTTRWTGEAVVITPRDPFTAQAQVATQVAEALRVALRPADRAALARRATDDPEALAAYSRGLALVDATHRRTESPAAWQRAADEFARAVALDSTFGEAWGWLAAAATTVAMQSPGDRAVEVRARATVARALAHAPDNPRALLTASVVRATLDHDTTGMEALARRVIAVAPNDALGLQIATNLALDHHQFDSAYSLARRTAALDPRSASRLARVSGLAVALRRWREALGYADAVIALDSTDEQGWTARMAVATAQGDTLGLQREAARALASLPRPSTRVMTTAAYAGGVYGPRYLTASARELDAATLSDSVNFYDTKADVVLRLGELARSRVYSDSVRRLLAGRPLTGPQESGLLQSLAFAQANLADTAAARRTLGRAIALARMQPWMQPPAHGDSLPVPGVDVITAAATYARLGETETAVRWIEAGYATSSGGWTARAYAIEPKLLVLRGTPAFERFLRAHPEKADP